MPRTSGTTKPSDTAAVDAYMQVLKHPLADLAAEVRRTILAANKTIDEEIKWNAPAFFKTHKKTLVAALKAQLRHMK